MMMSTKLPNEERPVDPQAQENIDRILHADAPKGSIGAATARAASHGGVGPHNILAVLNEMGHIRPTPEPKPTRAKRSDAGKPRLKPEPSAPATGKLSAADAAEGLRLIQERDSKRAVWDTFEDHASKAQEEFDAADAAVLAWLRDHTA